MFKWWLYYGNNRKKNRVPLTHIYKILFIYLNFDILKILFILTFIRPVLFIKSPK